MAGVPLQVESIDHLTENIFVLNFSDDTVAVLTAEELAAYYADRRMTAKGFSHMLLKSN